jgi:7-carboxy-7-deazaguanine synthase
MDVSVNLVEVFSSIQGEGTTVGSSTLFVRFGECDLRCRWCDSPHTWKPAAECQIEVTRGTGEFRTQSNPLRIADVVAAADVLEVVDHEFVSLTGGEPLLQPAAAREIAVALRARGPRVLLETHGVASQGLESVIDVIDVVSMDWKLTSDVRRATDARNVRVKPFDDEHERFLSIARRAPEVNVKLVVTCDSTDDEIDQAVDRVARVAPDATLIVQPVTPSGPVRDTPSAERLLALCARIGTKLPRVRLIPQTHKSYGAR